MTAARKKRYSRSDRIFYSIIYIIISLLVIIMAYPLLNIVSNSFSSPAAVQAGKVILFPVDFSVEGYRAVFRNRYIGVGYANTAFYTVAGTFVNVFMTMVCAFPLSRKELPFRNFFMFVFTFTMFFSGGMIPNYILMRSLNLINTRAVMIIPSMISVFNVILARTFINNSIPEELLEASQMDGCGYSRFFFTMILPLSKACMAVIALYSAVGFWNSYFNAFIYLNNREMYPLSLFLREILVANQMLEGMDIDPQLHEKIQGLADLLKYSLIIVSTLPIMCLYPFIQKNFTKGVMIGSLKG